MKNIISVLLPLILILNISCSGDKTDQELLEKDKKELVEKKYRLINLLKY